MRLPEETTRGAAFVSSQLSTPRQELAGVAVTRRERYTLLAARHMFEVRADDERERAQKHGDIAEVRT
jgi:hypothetical protein